MKIGDTVRDPKSGITGTVTDIVGHHILVKSDHYPIPCIICGHAKMVVNDDETEFAVYCDCGIAQTGETKEEAIASWNNLHAMTPGRCTFDE